MSNLVQIARLGGRSIFHDPEDRTLVIESGLSIDADGSPRAYHPDGRSGLDFLANAGRPGNWWGLACSPHGEPYIQGPDDPAPGFYVSTTALVHPDFMTHDPHRYVDSETVPYIVLPSHFVDLTGIEIPLGTEVGVLYPETGKSCAAIIADIGPRNHFGEGSIALALKLGIPADPRNGGCDNGVHYTIWLP